MFRRVQDLPAWWPATAITRAARSGLLSPVLLLAVTLDDAWLMPRAPSYAVLGLFDEPAHLATSVILLLAVAALLDRARSGRGVRSVRPMFGVGLLLAGNLIDVDHVPQVLGSYLLTAGTPRPYSHSLALLVPLLVGVLAGRGRGRLLAAGVALGVAGHLLRDLGTAPVALFWPVSSAGVTIPHTAYLVLLGAAAVLPGVLRVLNPRSAGADTPAETAPAHGQLPEGGNDGQVGRNPLPD